MSELWNELVNTAMVGTSKKDPNTNSWPKELRLIADQISQQNQDKEDVFLKTSGLIYNYKKSGWVPKPSYLTPTEVCEKEDLPYCSSQASICLQVILDESLTNFLEYWLVYCKNTNRIVLPIQLQALLEIASANPNLQEHIMKCCGKRGLWLSKLNPNWQIKVLDSQEDVFKTGKSDERKKALFGIRQSDPAKARDLLQESWKQEQANTRADLLDALNINLSIEDEPFLKSITEDKSQRVKDKTYALLKNIPGSYICEEVFLFTKSLVSLKKSNALLGLLQKESIELDLNFELPPSFKKYGFDDLQVAENYTEKELLLYKLISSVPPNYWENHFSLTPVTILEVFEKRKESKKYLSAFALAANSFKNLEWAILLYTKYKKLCIDLVPLFADDLKEEIALDLVEEYANNIYLILPDLSKEWTLSFCTALLKFTVNDPYTFSKNYFRKIAHHFPISILDEIESFHPKNENYTGNWNTIKTEIIKLIEIKKLLIESF